MTLNYVQAREVAGLMHRLSALQGWEQDMVLGLEQNLPFSLGDQNTLVLDDAATVRRAALTAVRHQLDWVKQDLAKLGVTETGLDAADDADAISHNSDQMPEEQAA